MSQPNSNMDEGNECFDEGAVERAGSSKSVADHDPGQSPLSGEVAGEATSGGSEASQHEKPEMLGEKAPVRSEACLADVDAAAREAVKHIQTESSRRMDELRRHLEEGEQEAARHNAELRRLSRLLFELCAEVRRLDSHVTAKRSQEATPRDLPSLRPAEACAVERKLSAVMGRPASRKVDDVPDPAFVDDENTGHPATAGFQSKASLLASPASHRPTNRRRSRFLKSPALHLAAGGLVAAFAGAALHWVRHEAPTDHPPVVSWSAATASLAKPATSEPKTVARTDQQASRDMPVPPAGVPYLPSQNQPIVGKSAPFLQIQVPPPPPGPALPGVPDAKAAASIEKPPNSVASPASSPKPAIARVDSPKATMVTPKKGPAPEPPKKAKPSPRPKQPPAKAVETEMVLIDIGTLIMGDGLDGLKDASPHCVILSPFWIARHEVTLELWEKVRKWGGEHGYGDLPAGMGKNLNHPVYAVARDDAAKWCNARSEMEKLMPCYYEDERQTVVFRAGEANLSNRCVKWDADGFRLPTEAEWEAAARGRLEGRRFPWGDQISHQNANYSSTSSSPYDKNGRRGPPLAYSGQLPHTSPVGSFKSNGLGLYDMAGNVAEWCWDFYDKHYGIAGLEEVVPGGPSLSLPAVKDPKGPDSGMSCVVRGGSWRHDATDARCASRFDLPGGAPSPHVGFRLVRRS